MIPLSIPNFEGNELKYVMDAVGQGWVSTGGAYIEEFERQIEDFLHIEKAVACQSGTAALHLALMECGVAPGELVIAPTLTFIAAVNPIRYIGADPLFMDCDDSLCMDGEKLEAFCKEECRLTQEGLMHKSSGKLIRAVIVVHVFGNMADMERIMDIAERYQLKVIEDATEALGTKYTEGRYAGRYAGTIGEYGAFSFNGNKIITTGGGGMAVGRNASRMNHIRYLSTQAKDDDLFYIHNEVGYNYRMTNVQAALGVAQMELLKEFIRRKNSNYDCYRELLSGLKNVKLMQFRKGTDANKWFYALHMHEMPVDIQTLVHEFMENGIQTRAIWGLVHRQKPYRSCHAFRIERAEYYGSHILNLPCSTNLTEKEISYVCQEIKRRFP